MLCRVVYFLVPAGRLEMFCFTICFVRCPTSRLRHSCSAVIPIRQELLRFLPFVPLGGGLPHCIMTNTGMCQLLAEPREYPTTFRCFGITIPAQHTVFSLTMTDDVLQDIVAQRHDTSAFNSTIVCTCHLNTRAESSHAYGSE